MGLVGFLLTPVATQLSVDYLRTQDFAMRPLQWLKLISKNRGTVSVAPPFGYELCQRRVNEKDLAELDLSCWRVAGIGAEPISAEQLHQFAECFRQVNFDDKTFMPCYGLAENALAVSFSDEASGVVVNRSGSRHPRIPVKPSRRVLKHAPYRLSSTAVKRCRNMALKSAMKQVYLSRNVW